ncbi:hypothetical protein K457DRAFT_26310 [Linnemannia elongata AG-77]|uniref:Uncharacterized protein n=1 Tax=Linnemannia elongata AG-77 TaxID=1314771 RepID=A0A197JCM3_9FUNG|nr:hypothetical protein K457DRAFT_26310 [Linnemannia elongata AG-77]
MTAFPAPVITFYTALSPPAPAPDIMLNAAAAETPIQAFVRLPTVAHRFPPSDQMIDILRTAISDVTNAPTAVLRSTERTRNASLASNAIVEYLIAHARAKKTAPSTANSQQVRQGVQNGRVPGINDALESMLALAGDTRPANTLPTNRDTLTELIGHFFSGGIRYARYAKQKQDKTREHVATAMGFGFALLGFAPIVGQFAGLADLVADATLRHFWVPKDPLPFIQHLLNNFITRAAAGMDDATPHSSEDFRNQINDIVGATSQVDYGRPRRRRWYHRLLRIK